MKNITKTEYLKELRELNLTYDEALIKFDANNKAWSDLGNAEQDLIIELLKNQKDDGETDDPGQDIAIDMGR
tara:strand:+ start:191 stop:406 length:216 start_codon:yes stop_codon:yes gene_type:complete